MSLREEKIIQAHCCASHVIICVKKQEDMIFNQQSKQSLETNAMMTNEQDTGIISTITVFKVIKEKFDVLHKQMGNFG